MRLCWFWTMVVSSRRYRIACTGFSSRLELIIPKARGRKRRRREKKEAGVTDGGQRGCKISVSADEKVRCPSTLLSLVLLGCG